MSFELRIPGIRLSMRTRAYIKPIINRHSPVALHNGPGPYSSSCARRMSLVLTHPCNLCGPLLPSCLLPVCHYPNLLAATSNYDHFCMHGPPRPFKSAAMRDPLAETDAWLHRHANLCGRPYSAPRDLHDRGRVVNATPPPRPASHQSCSPHCHPSASQPRRHTPHPTASRACLHHKRRSPRLLTFVQSDFRPRRRVALAEARLVRWGGRRRRPGVTVASPP